MTSESFIHFNAVSKTYVKKGIPLEVLHHIHLQIPKHSFTCILGPSGAGKTTLLHLMGMLDDPSSGEIKIENTLVSSLSKAQKSAFRNETMGFIFQNFNLLPELTLLENVCLPLLPKHKYTKQHIDFALYMLETAGLSHRLHHFPGEMSGGELQRGSIIRSLVLKPKLILADEPTGNLDSENAHLIFNLMLSFHKEMQSCLILVTHNESLSNLASQKIRLRDGKLATP